MQRERNLRPTPLSSQPRVFTIFANRASILKRAKVLLGKVILNVPLGRGRNYLGGKGGDLGFVK